MARYSPLAAALLALVLLTAPFCAVRIGKARAMHAPANLTPQLARRS
jgi:hypothetical protein